jgi:lysophospholipase L1-like esterase
MANPNTVYAQVADGAGGTTVQFVDFGVPVAGTYVPCSPAGSVGARPLVLYNFDLAAQLPRFLAKYAAGQATNLVAIGDSVTKGFGATRTSANIVQLSYPGEMAKTLAAQGIAASYANFVGADDLFGVSVDFRLQFLATAQLGVPLAGGNTVQIQPTTTFGFSFTVDLAADYDQVTLTYLDTGTAVLTLALDGVVAGERIQLHGTDSIKSHSIDFPLNTYAKLTVTLEGNQTASVQTAALGNSRVPDIQVYNAGSGGMTTEAEINPPGKSPLDGALALAPDLAFVNLGVNDILSGVPVAKTLANLDNIVSRLQAKNAEVMLFVPLPLIGTAYQQEIPLLRAGLQKLALEKNIPLVDLGLTYDDSFDLLNNAGLMGDSFHPNATLAADIGSQLGMILAKAIKG